MKVTLRISLILGMCALVAALPAGAACAGGDLRLFTGYNYYAGSNGVVADVLGTFWQLGNFAAANNGTWPANVWLADTGGGTYFPAGGWQGDAGIIGCPVPAGPAVVKMAFIFSAPSAGNGAVYGAGCEQSDPGSGNFEFGSSASGGTVPMQPIPKPSVASSTRIGTTAVQIVLNPPVVPGGVFDEATCGLAPQGYRLYARVIGRNAPAPTDRRRVAGGWAPVGGLNAPNAQSTVTVPCVGSQDVYLGYGIVFNEGQELQHVGANSTVVQCGQTSADQPTDFKIIKKPIRRPTSAQ